jgi:rhodanese-related sulfurtransferase
MQFPLEAFGAVSASNPWTYLVFGVIGYAFGFTLEMAGFGDSRKLAGQFYFKELTVFKVMFTAIAVAMVLIWGAVGLGLLDFGQVWVNPTYLGSGIVGGLIMGVGFIIGGFCPTTSLASASTGKIDGMFFMLGGFVGAFLFAETQGYYDNWYNNSGYLGRLTLDQVFGIPASAIVLMIVGAALFFFWLAERVEHTVGGKNLAAEPRMRKFGAAGLLAAAVMVLFIGSPTLEDRYQKLSFQRTEVIEQADAEPLTLTRVYSADEMLAQRRVFTTPAEAFKARYNQSVNPLFLDVRQESDYNLYHIADSISTPLDTLAERVPDLLAEPPGNTVIVTISNDEAAAVQAWKLLVASGVPNVYVLEGGINRWIAFFGKDDSLLKPIASAADDELGYAFKAALGSRYPSCAPDPIEHEHLEFDPRIVLQLKRDKSGGGCG